MSLCAVVLDRVLERDTDFILKVITGDDIQIYRYDADLRISKQFKPNRPKHLAIF